MPIIKNKIFVYLATRYFTYGLQFFLSLIIAVRLGPYFLGVYGLVNLILNYFGQINFGIPHSLNVLLVHSKDDSEMQRNYTFNSCIILSVFSFLIVLGAVIWVIIGGVQMGEYDIRLYFPFIIIIAILAYFNTIVTTVVRFKNRVQLLSIIGTIPVLMNLFVVLFFESKELVLALVCANLLSCIIVLIIGASKGVFTRFERKAISLPIQKQIVTKGLYLFLYNSCFYFILLSVRTIISSNYSVEEFGYFTFSYTIANAVMLLLDSLNTIIFPKSIDILSNKNSADRLSVLNKLRIGYITSSHFLVYISMVAYPFFIMLFPQYSKALTSMNIVSLAVLMNTNSYGYITLLIAQNKERTTSKISTCALVIAIIAGISLARFVHVEFSFVAIAMLIAYLVFSFMATYEGSKLLGEKSSFNYTIRHFFPLKLLIPYGVAFILSILKSQILAVLPLLIFAVLNWRDIRYLITLVVKLKNNPNIIDIK